ncbi:MAG: cytochrome c oxidase accessory protein CcoG [Alphaproteobacteria bacterium]|nr:cytochrome c oxidase accessory protein CcoG [Alphaproteobacteria bacterium]
MTATETGIPVDDVRSFKADGKPPLYEARNRVYPKDVKGPLRRFKWIILIVLLGIYYTVPWLRWDREPGMPDQAVLIDLPARRAYFFFIEIWPHEVYYITGLLVFGAVGLFLATSLLGRVWCGYACPQTVWTDLFMWVERKIEGDRNARIRLDKKPLSRNKVIKKVLKHGAWILIGIFTGGAWILYFNDAPTVLPQLLTGEASLAIYGFVGLFAATTYTLAGWAREQLCTYMCPWPRFQAAMFDENTLVVTYEDWRGEPRGRHRQGQSWEGRGDCVDCRQCVTVCPTGIDIRDGNQLECIGCGLCIDACNAVMEKVGRPRDLIMFDTTLNQINRAESKELSYKLLRPRTLIYASIMALAAAVMIGTLITRPSLHVNVLHDRSPLFIPMSDGSIRNGYTLKISNMRNPARAFDVSIEGIADARLDVSGQTTGTGTNARLQVGQDDVATYRVFVTVPRDDVASESTDLVFIVEAPWSGETTRYKTVFRGPDK